MKKKMFVLTTAFLAATSLFGQNIQKCAVQEKLASDSIALFKQYGKVYVRAALNGEIVDNMPEALLLKAFNAVAKKSDKTNVKSYEIYSDKILQPRRPNMMAPKPSFIVQVANKKVLKILPASQNNSRYNIDQKNKLVVY